MPQRGPLGRVARERERGGEGQADQSPLGARKAVGERRIRRRMHFNEERRVADDGEPRDHRRSIAQRLRHP